MYNTEIMVTADGSHSLYVPALKEHFHSVNGALSESLHVFIGNGFNFLTDREEIFVLEIGFGTGLNCLLTLMEACRRGISTRYYALELNPLNAKTIAALNYPDITGCKEETWFRDMHASPWGEPVKLTPGFELVKIQADFISCGAEIIPPCHLVYYDAFGPEKQPGMWTPELFRKLSSRMEPGTLLVTYCARGKVRRDLTAAGFVMERLPGQKGKREMLRGIRGES